MREASMRCRQGELPVMRDFARRMTLSAPACPRAASVRVGTSCVRSVGTMFSTTRLCPGASPRSSSPVQGHTVASETPAAKRRQPILNGANTAFFNLWTRFSKVPNRGSSARRSPRRSCTNTSPSSGRVAEWLDDWADSPVPVGLQKTKMAKSMISKCWRIGSRRPAVPTGPGQQLGG